MAKRQNKHINKLHPFQTHNKIIFLAKHHSEASFWLNPQLLSKLEIITFTFLSILTLHLQAMFWIIY